MKKEVYVDFDVYARRRIVEFDGNDKLRSCENPTQTSMDRLVRTVRKLVDGGRGRYHVFTGGWSWTAK